MRQLRRRIFGVVILLATARLLGAQELRGTVREAASGIPIPGAVLLMLDSSGATRARNITDERGAYRVAASAWMRRLRVVRIGFRPSEVELPPIGGDVVTTDVVMTAIPVLLEPVRVKSGARCPKRNDRLAALSLLEQARAGLLATIVAREAKPAEIVRVHFTSELRGKFEEPVEMAVQIDSTDTTHVSFIAPRSAGDFVREGFASERDGGTTFDGPDAETLLDDDFRDGYCFQLRESEASRPNQVGLGFVAAASRRGRIDIDGTLWIDTVARRLKDIQFNYVNLPAPLQRVHPAGQIQFRELENGIVIVDRWSLRLPVALSPPAPNRNTRSRRLDSGPIGVQSAGAFVASARWPGGLQWNAPLGALRVRVADPRGQHVSGRELVLSNTPYHAMLDTAGVATIARLVPGPYAAVIRDSELDSIQIGLKTTLRFTVTASETIETDATVPTATNYVESRCRASSISPGEPGDFLIIGRTFDSTSKVVGSATWKLTRRNADFQDTWDAVTASDGIFEFCGNQFRAGDEVTIEARRSPADPPVSQTLRLTRRLTVVRLILPPSVR